MLRTPLQAGITLLADHSVPHHFAVNNLQRLMRTLWHALSAIITAPHRPRIVTIFAAQIAALQKQSQTTAWPVNAGKGDNLTD
jgi:LPS O-antigen subunit length determinant protein (WzzB/FepE family)